MLEAQNDAPFLGLQKKRMLQMTILHGPVRSLVPRKRMDKLTAFVEDRHQLLWRDDFQLRVRAISWRLIEPPPAKLRHVPKAAVLHVLVSYLCD